jgi:hypothetical protein
MMDGWMDGWMDGKSITNNVVFNFSAYKLLLLLVLNREI